MSTAVFIVLEGIDGAGTTTQAARLAERLRRDGRTAHVTREPSDGPIGKMVRGLLSGAIGDGIPARADMMALLFAADRLDHNVREIDAALASGSIVISDRYDLSSLAYQQAAAESVIPSEELVGWIRSLNRFARRPDLTLVLDVPAEAAAARRAARGGTPELYEKEALQARLAEIYRHGEALVPQDRLVHLDGTHSADAVEGAIAETVNAFLVARGSAHTRPGPC